ncbi:MAG: ribosome silencing factor [Bacilli bacterium]|mgnify:CR=1 FL=1|nr:ribosome silencing factor [Bacilli bacterium]
MRRDKVVTLIKKVLDEHKATNIEVIDVSERTPFADFYVVASASNIRQLDALADNVIDELEKNKINVNHKEGTPESGWILIDVYHVIVNIFTEAERERVGLEQVLSKK